MALPKDVIEIGHIRLYKALAAVVTDVVKVVFGVWIFWILKDWLFTKIYELSGWAFAQKWASIGFLFWPTMIIAGLIILNLILMWLTNYYDIYPDRIVIKTGVFARTRRSVDMDQFAALEVAQGFWGRLLGYGNIIFMFEAMTTIVTKQGIVLQGVRQPDRLVDSAASFLKAAKPQKRGMVMDKRAKIIPEVVSETPKSEIEPVPKQTKNEVINEPAVKTEAVAVSESAAAQTSTQSLRIEGEIDFSK